MGTIIGIGGNIKGKGNNNDVVPIEPTCFIIDQRGAISDPTDMVSSLGRYRLNTFTPYTNEELEDNTINHVKILKDSIHRYLGTYNDETEEMSLQQLDDNNTTKFASNGNKAPIDSTEHDVWTKFDTDIWYKSDFIVPPDETEVNNDYVLISITTKKPYDVENWIYWNKDTLIGTYKASRDGDMLHSSSHKKACSNYLTSSNCNSYAAKRGKGFEVIDYPTHRFIAIMGFATLGTLCCQAVCGFGTGMSSVDTYSIWTGFSNSLGINNTTYLTSEDLKVINILGIENLLGDAREVMPHIRGMCIAKDASYTAGSESEKYIIDYFNVNNVDEIECIVGGNRVILTLNDALKKYYNTCYIKVRENDKDRFIEFTTALLNGNIKKLQFGKYCDVIPKDISGTKTTYYTNWVYRLGNTQSAGYSVARSGYRQDTNNGLCYLGSLTYYTDTEYWTGSRLLYKGKIKH